MKLSHLLISLILTVFSPFCNVELHASEPLTQDTLYNSETVAEKPTFPGGDEELYKYIAATMRYPASAVEEGVSGRVIVSFIVEKDGTISNVKVLRGKHRALDNEAVRIVKRMPAWKPGQNNGKPVRVTCLLPLNFKL